MMNLAPRTGALFPQLHDGVLECNLQGQLCTAGDALHLPPQERSDVLAKEQCNAQFSSHLPCDVRATSARLAICNAPCPAPAVAVAGGANCHIISTEAAPTVAADAAPIEKIPPLAAVAAASNAADPSSRPLQTRTMSCSATTCSSPRSLLGDQSQHSVIPPPPPPHPPPPPPPPQSPHPWQTRTISWSARA